MLARELGPCLAVLLNAREVVAIVEAPTAVVQFRQTFLIGRLTSLQVASGVDLNRPDESWGAFRDSSLSHSPLTGPAAKQMSIEEATISDGSGCRS